MKRIVRILAVTALTAANVTQSLGEAGLTGVPNHTQTFAPQQYDLTRLRRSGPDSYEMVYPDGSKTIFGLRSTLGSVLLTRVEDAAGNAITLTWTAASSGTGVPTTVPNPKVIRHFL